MRKQYIFHTLVTIILIVNSLSGCKPEDSPSPYNPLNGLTTAVFNPDKNYGTVSDIDGNIYKTIVIGDQTWMAENLRTTRYRNGDSIPNITDNIEWNDQKTGAYCVYNNSTDLDTIATYGRLYNWYAVADSRGLAPKGWRVPTITDWNILIDYLGGDSVASNKMKEVGIYHWEDRYQSDNNSGFTAIPSGAKYLYKECNYVGFTSVYWTSSEFNNENAGFLYIYYFSSNVSKGVNFKQNGYSIRCIKE